MVIASRLPRLVQRRQEHPDPQHLAVSHGDVTLRSLRPRCVWSGHTLRVRMRDSTADLHMIRPAPLLRVSSPTCPHSHMLLPASGACAQFMLLAAIHLHMLTAVRCAHLRRNPQQQGHKQWQERAHDWLRGTGEASVAARFAMPVYVSGSAAGTADGNRSRAHVRPPTSK